MKRKELSKYFNNYRKLGGFIYSGRVGAQLALTRSIGDHYLRKDGVIPNPTINRLVVKQNYKWLVIATDGIWDWFDERELTTVIGEKEFSAESIAKQLLKIALERGSKDNITCLVIRL